LAILALGEKARDAFRDLGTDFADLDEDEFFLNRLYRDYRSNQSILPKS